MLHVCVCTLSTEEHSNRHYKCMYMSAVDSRCVRVYFPYTRLLCIYSYMRRPCICVRLVYIFPHPCYTQHSTSSRLALRRCTNGEHNSSALPAFVCDKRVRIIVAGLVNIGELLFRSALCWSEFVGISSHWYPRLTLYWWVGVRWHYHYQRWRLHPFEFGSECERNFRIVFCDIVNGRVSSWSNTKAQNHRNTCSVTRVCAEKEIVKSVLSLR